MKKSFFIASITLLIAVGVITAPSVEARSLKSRVNEAYRLVFLKNPTPEQNQYWLTRVARGEKKTFTALVGAMFYQKAFSAFEGLPP